MPGLRLSRPSGARDTNNAITVESEREREKTVKSRVPPPPNNYTTIEDEWTMRCGGGVDDGAVVVVVCRRVVQTTVATLSVPDGERLSVRKVEGPPRFVRVPYQRTTREKLLFFIVYSSSLWFSVLGGTTMTSRTPADI